MNPQRDTDQDRECAVCPTVWIIRNAAQKPVTALLILAGLLAALYVFNIL